MIKKFNRKSKRRRIWRRVPKCILDFGLVRYAAIYSLKDGKYGQTPMKILKVTISAVIGKIILIRQKAR